MFPGAHIEIAADSNASWHYCSKEESRVEGPVHFGVMPKPKKVKGASYKEYNEECLENLEGMVADGRVPIKDYQKLANSVQLYKLRTSDQKPISDLEHEWHFGPTGTGKSLAVRRAHPGAYYKLPNKWWDGYRGQEHVIIEDVQKEHSVLGYHFKIWADHYPFTAEVKGSSIALRPRKVVVTSNYHPSEIWSDENVLAPILRRFKLHQYHDAIQVKKGKKPSTVLFLEQSSDESAEQIKEMK